MNASAFGPNLSGLTVLPPLPVRIQKVSVRAHGVVIEAYRGEKVRLTLGPRGLTHTIDADVEEGSAPASAQAVARKELVPSQLVDASQDSAGGITLVFSCPDDKRRTLVLEAGDDARVVLLANSSDSVDSTAASARVLAVLFGVVRPPDGRDLRRGAVYVAPPAGKTTSRTSDGSTSTPTRAPATTHPLVQQLRAEIRRLGKLEKALRGDLVRHGDGARHEHDGEVLKTVMGQLKRGQTSVEAVDFDGEPRVIALDAKLDAVGNLHKLFARAKRARTAHARVAPRLVEVELRLSLLSPLLAQAAPSEPEWLARVQHALAEHTARPSTKRTVAKSAKRKAWRAFVLAPDVVVRVGRGAKDNDALVREARGLDLWLHARDRVGAHVVIPSRGEDVPDALLRDAAVLAAHFSSARGETRVDVQHTRVKHLRKPPGAPAGLVHVTNESVIAVRLDPDHVKSLLHTEVPA